MSIPQDPNCSNGQIHIRFSRGSKGEWLVDGLPREPARQFGTLVAAYDYAKQACAAQPALIELFSDGLYATAHQDEGWPHRLCRPQMHPGGRRDDADRTRALSPAHGLVASLAARCAALRFWLHSVAPLGRTKAGSH